MKASPCSRELARIAALLQQPTGIVVGPHPLADVARSARAAMTVAGIDTLDPPTVRRVAQRLFEALVPGGWLVTGPSDPTLGAHAPVETVLTDMGVVYRRGEPAVASFVRTHLARPSEATAAVRSLATQLRTGLTFQRSDAARGAQQ